MFSRVSLRTTAKMERSCRHYIHLLKGTVSGVSRQCIRFQALTSSFHSYLLVAINIFFNKAVDGSTFSRRVQSLHGATSGTANLAPTLCVHVKNQVHKKTNKHPHKTLTDCVKILQSMLDSQVERNRIKDEVAKSNRQTP